MDVRGQAARELTDRLCRLAGELGFEVVGAAPAGPVTPAEPFCEWLQAGRHGSMEWLARDPDRRLDPLRVLPGVRSIVAVGMSCHAPDLVGAAPPAASGPTGRIARYARGADYHNVMGKKLRRLLALLRAEFPGLDGRASVDTGPVMDRAWAVNAGLGWWGKHTNLVSRAHGSWLLLGTLLLNRELVHDAPHRDYCGSCRRCIDVCPTRAIVAEHVLDARLCISYLTIEHRGPIPPELRPLMGNWIFGCDLCLEVCPWNRFAQAAREARFAAREDRAAPALRPLLDLDDAAFRAKFHGSPIQRPGRDGFLRNVCVALGNTGGAADLPALTRVAAHDASELVREHAAWALGEIERRGGGH